MTQDIYVKRDWQQASRIVRIDYDGFIPHNHGVYPDVAYIGRNLIGRDYVIGSPDDAEAALVGVSKEQRFKGIDMDLHKKNKRPCIWRMITGDLDSALDNAIYQFNDGARVDCVLRVETIKIVRPPFVKYSVNPFPGAEKYQELDDIA